MQNSVVYLLPRNLTTSTCTHETFYVADGSQGFGRRDWVWHRSRYLVMSAVMSGRGAFAGGT